MFVSNVLDENCLKITQLFNYLLSVNGFHLQHLSFPLAADS